MDIVSILLLVNDFVCFHVLVHHLIVEFAWISVREVVVEHTTLGLNDLRFTRLRGVVERVARFSHFCVHDLFMT